MKLASFGFCIMNIPSSVFNLCKMVEEIGWHSEESTEEVWKERKIWPLDEKEWVSSRGQRSKAGQLFGLQPPCLSSPTPCILFNRILPASICSQHILQSSFVAGGTVRKRFILSIFDTWATMYLIMLGARNTPADQSSVFQAHCYEHADELGEISRVKGQGP